MQDSLVCEMCGMTRDNGFLTRGKLLCDTCCPIHKNINCVDLMKNQTYQLCIVCRYCTLVVDQNKKYCVNPNCNFSKQT